MSANEINPKIVVVGTGADLAVVAFTVAKKLESLHPAVIAVDVGGGESAALVSTFSDMKHFNDTFSISEDAFIKGVGAGVNFGFALGEQHEGQPFIFSDSPYGLVMHNSLFHQLFHLYRQEQTAKRLDDFCLSARLAKAGKFAPQSNQANSVFSTISYGYTFSASAYEKFFRQLAIKYHVTFVSSRGIDVAEGADGIEKVLTSTGQALAADLYIDCSSEGALTNKRGNSHCAYSINPAYVPPWCFSTNEEPQPDGGDKPLFATISAAPNGHIKRIKHGQAVSIETIEYATAESRDTQPANAHRQAVALQRPWVGNCVALGSACVNIPNLLPGGYNLLQGQLLQFFDIWSGNTVSAAAAELFNQSSTQAVQHLIDLANIQLAAHPVLSTVVSLTESNRSRVSLFEASGALYMSENGIVSDQHWPALLMALGFEQKGESLQTSGLEHHRVVEELDRLESLLQRATDAAPPYQAWLKENGYAQ